MNTFLQRLVFTGILVFSSLFMFAPPATPGGSPPPACWPPPCIPIDGGLGILMLAGAGLALKTTYDSYKKSKKVED